MVHSASCCSVIELRQYTTQPGKRDLLVDLFDREFVETQEVHGMHVVGQFRDRDRPDRFVWMRGFPDMRTRGVALPAFYGGPVWALHRDAANATMIDSDNVFLLRRALPETGLTHQDLARPAQGADAPPESLVEVMICPLRMPADEKLLRHIELTVLPAMNDAGGQSVACYMTEPAENNFPALPVRTGENVLVWITSSGSASGPVGPREVGASRPDLMSNMAPALQTYLAGPPETLRLSPTPRSQLR